METTVITCDCTVCNGLKARVKGSRKNWRSAVKRHNVVRIAHSPLARAGGSFCEPVV